MTENETARVEKLRAKLTEKTEKLKLARETILAVKANAREQIAAFKGKSKAPGKAKPRARKASRGQTVSATA